ncbi:MAG TPA: DHA2 family efflux MFS transporter permease subunit [Candidatus Binataceae bacterium]|jgi:DHA2 family multidrug resistance protein|nr:DHA2 family efflux MFS transporter permease subunit [Candidatus Binataceae bacterium]
MAFALYGMVVVLAPAIGPTIGGWITDNYQWRWIFYMNVPVGVLSLFLVSRFVEDPYYLTRQLKQARKSLSIDYAGIGLLALCLGALQVVLDRGQEDDWFVSHLISILAVVFVVSLVSFVIWELTRRRPVLDLRLFKNRNFAAAAMMIFVYGIQVYGMTVFIPQFMQAYMGYNAQLAGMTLAPGATVMIVLMPVVGKLVRRVQARWLTMAGFLASAFALYFVTMHIDQQIDFRTAATYRCLQSLGLAVLFIPINTASYVGVPEEKGGEVSGLINLLRNVGGSVGISMVETMVTRRAQFHQDELIAHVTPARQSFRTFTDRMSTTLFHRGLSQSQAMRQSYLRAYDAVVTQATVQSYMDVSWLIAVVCLLMAPLALLLKRNDTTQAQVVAE